MVTTTEVELAYRYILGREPESAEVVEDLAARSATFAQLRTLFFSSEEFQKAGHPVPAHAAVRPLHWGPNPVDVSVAPADLERMLRRVEETWKQLGDSEPFWSVLTHENYRSENLEANKATFYESGKTAVVNFRAALDRAGLGLAPFSSCVEYGCGVGRLTIWLASQFANVVGCDISQPHLDAARLALDERGIDNVSLRLTDTIKAVRRLPPFDVFFCLIVLQHNPPPVAAFILDEILGKLAPGGVAYFQIPTYRIGYAFDAKAYLALDDSAGPGGMEMHVVPQKDLFALFERRGCGVLEVREDTWVGSPEFISNTFLVRKAR